MLLLKNINKSASLGVEICCKFCDKKDILWLSKDSKDLILKRDKAYQLASRSGLDSDWTGYKQLRNQAISQLRKDKINWQQGKLDSCEEGSDSGRLWKNILGWLNWTSTSSPTKLSSNGSIETSPKRISEYVLY